MDSWYREQLRNAVPPLIEKWQRLMGVRVERYFIQRMKTKWGSCNQRTKSIRLNTDLARKPRECLEYIVVHEMAHLLERTHNDRFVALMDRFMPKWQFRREILNSLPLRQENWDYLQVRGGVCACLGDSMSVYPHEFPPGALLGRDFLNKCQQRLKTP
jgi:predicted metal-dependent hydrolase